MLQIATQKDIYAILAKCLDPELKIDIVSLGFVYGLKIKGNEILITLTLTSPSCPYVDDLSQNIVNSIRSKYDQAIVNIEWSFDPPWNPENLSPQIKKLIHLQ